MSNSNGVNWIRVYFWFVCIRILIGLVNNEDFRTWMINLVIGTIIWNVVRIVEESTRN